ncbi:MAG TPA: flavin reductase family protein [Micromonosporaceae bacterium]
MAEQTTEVAKEGRHVATPVDPTAFRDAMACFPTGVTIVTTVDAYGQAHGLTVSSFCSVSLRPPLVSFCVSETANCFPAFAECDRFAVSVLRPHHAALARRFASKRRDKFADGGFGRTPSGLPVADGALAVVECRVYDRYPGGDHLIVLGEVFRAHTDRGTPLVFVGRTFTQVSIR